MKIESLPTTHEELQKIIDTALKNANSRIHYLEEQVRILNMKLFAPKSEKRTDSKIQPQLFNEIESIAKEKVTHVPEHDRVLKKGGRKPLPANLPEKRIDYDITEDDKKALEGCEIKKIGEEVCEKLACKPAEFYREKHCRAKYAVANRQTGESSILVAGMPAQILPKTMATPSLLSLMITSKFCDSVPFYRQEKILERYGIFLPRQTMGQWFMKLHESMKVLDDILLDKLKESEIVGMDETRVKVLYDEQKDGPLNGYMWVRWGDPGGKAVRLFCYDRSRSSRFISEFVKDYHGRLITDGYEAYVKALRGTDVVHAGCWAHARRGFVEALEAADGKSPNAEKAIDYIKKLYDVELEARNQTLNIDQILELRKNKSKPIIEEIKVWLDQIVATLPPKQKLGQAVRYVLDDWTRLTVFLGDGLIPIDNNKTENTIRPFVLGRKNWLFSGNTEGAEASAFYYSMIETAKANGLNAYWYMYYLFENFIYCKGVADYQRLMPYEVTMEQIVAYFKGIGIEVLAVQSESKAS